MFCAKCDCEFTGWTKKCPACSGPLSDRGPEDKVSAPETTAYQSLVERVEKHGGSITIKLFTTDVGYCRSTYFPGIGQGFAWPKIMGGKNDGVQAMLRTCEVRRERKVYFPFAGFGFAWAQRIVVAISDVSFTLVATKVERQKKWLLPLRMGWGFAWVQEMEGACGSRLRAKFTTTNVGRQTQSLPTVGWGYAWADRADLTLEIIS